MINKQKIKVLISAYAVRPNSGSETGVGWNYIKELYLQKKYEITVVTEIEFKTEIEDECKKLGLNINFIYISIGNYARRLCWNQGNWFFYFFYQLWQYKAYRKIKKIHILNPFDVVHHLNMIGFREPGYLWKLNDTKFIIGPLGGYGTANLQILSLNYSIKIVVKEYIKSLINYLQINYSIRFISAIKKANSVFVAYPEIKLAISKYCHPLILSENGCDNRKINFNSFYHPNNNKKYIIFVGKDVPRKNLNFLVKVFENEFFSEYELILLGNIKNQFKNKKIKSLGFVEHKKVANYLIHSDLHWFPSLHDSNATALIESLSFGVPTLAFNKWGTSCQESEILFKIEESEHNLCDKWALMSKKILDLKIPSSKRVKEANSYREKNNWKKLADIISKTYEQ